MDPRVRILFHELAELSPRQRQRVLHERQLAPDLRAELESLFSFDSEDGDRLAECVSEAASQILHSLPRGSVQRCGPYRLVRLLGRGGMGEVYVGERVDGEIQQTVAIKLLSAAGHRPGWLERFLQERHLLASLNHPSIVRVIDAGHVEDGRPYLAMEYVDGVSIDTYSARLEIAERLKLFLSVCEGVSHAHRRLIIHRDLKPSNILVDSSGQPKLLDFGIARLLDESADANQTTERLLTPNYASPEQFRGGNQTTATDVYSLGAVLYKVLTGRSPHESDDGHSQVSDILAGAREIPAPSRLNGKLSTELDWILAKALRPEAEDRYSSVDALARDVRAFLESRPIEARSRDAWYRTRKFLRRHWVPVLASAVMVASLSGGLYVANWERRIAEQRFAQLRQLSDQVFDLDMSLRDLPGSAQARQKLVSASLRYLEGLAAAARGDVGLSNEIGQGYWRVGRIQGVPSEPNLGERTQAESSLKRADEFVDRVLAARPNDQDTLLRSAIIANDRMVLAADEHRYDDALAQAHKSAGRLEEFLKRADAREAERAGLLYGNIALVHMNLRRYAEAVPYAEREAELARSIPSARLSADSGMLPVAKAMGHGDLEGALQSFEQSRRVAETTRYRTEALRKNDLYGIFFREGLVLGGDGQVNLGRPGDAMEAFRKAVEAADATAREDPKDATSRTHGARARMALANLLRHRNPREALSLYDAALHALGGLRRSLLVQRDQAMALADSSYPLRSLGRAGEGRKRIDAALAILTETGDYPAEHYSFDSPAFAALFALANHQAESGELSHAAESFEELSRTTAAGADSQYLWDAPQISRLYEARARLYRKTGDLDKANDMLSRRAELWRSCDRKFPANPFVRSQIACGNCF